jgi:hypothetical protein
VLYCFVFFWNAHSLPPPARLEQCGTHAVSSEFKIDVVAAELETKPYV